MRFFALSLDRLLLRFMAMMACVIGGLFIGQAWIAFLALPIFMSAILGVSFRSAPQPKQAQKTKVVSMPARQSAATAA